MKTSGIIFIILGIIGTLIFGIDAIGDSESFSFLGIEVGLSSANWTPLIVSVIILIIGIVLKSSANKSN